MSGIEHQVAGPTKIYFNSQALGYSRDGVRISFQPKWIDIASDDWGGASGAPADAQLVGAIATVQCELTKYDPVYCHALNSFYKTTDVAKLPVFGTLMRQGNYYGILRLDSTVYKWTFDVAIVRQGQEVNRGTRFSTFVCGFECWLDSTSSRKIFTEAAV